MQLALPEDVLQIFILSMHPVRIPYLGHAPTSEAFTEIFTDLRSHSRFYVAEEREQIIGFLPTQCYEGRTRHVGNIGPLALRRHITERAVPMLDEATALLQSEGVRHRELGVETDYPRAKSSYEN